jgi:hypothetical protein
MEGHIAAAVEPLDLVHLVLSLILISLLHYPMISLADLIAMNG